MSFAHGSNDVANAMGPFSAVFYIWENQAVPTKSPVRRPLFCMQLSLYLLRETVRDAQQLSTMLLAQVPEWILVLGGAGIVTGLALYGYKVLNNGPLLPSAGL